MALPKVRISHHPLRSSVALGSPRLPLYLTLFLTFQIVAFDLDATLWVPEMYQVTTAASSSPFARFLGPTHATRRNFSCPFPCSNACPPPWQLWGGGAPFTKNKDGSLTDRSGTRCTMMGNTAALLYELNTDPKWKDSKVGFSHHRQSSKITVDSSSKSLSTALLITVDSSSDIRGQSRLSLALSVCKQICRVIFIAGTRS